LIQLVFIILSISFLPILFTISLILLEASIIFHLPFVITLTIVQGFELFAQRLIRLIV
jgi:hypothetical protein